MDDDDEWMGATSGDSPSHSIHKINYLFIYLQISIQLLID
jgi:hypothetical protein